jgi:hypothetical protein
MIMIIQDTKEGEWDRYNSQVFSLSCRRRCDFLLLVLYEYYANENRFVILRCNNCNKLLRKIEFFITPTSAFIALSVPSIALKISDFGCAGTRRNVNCKSLEEEA